jgi:hypothetical protein
MQFDICKTGTKFLVLKNGKMRLKSYTWQLTVIAMRYSECCWTKSKSISTLSVVTGELPYTQPQHLGMKRLFGFAFYLVRRVKAKASYLHTALHAGSYNSHKGETRILLGAGADTNAQSDSVGTVLYESERREQCSSMLNLLRQHGAEDLPPRVEGVTDSDEWN